MPAEVESMMYVGAVPWHGLGVYCGDTPILAEEAIQAANLDWEVEKFPAVAAVTRGDEEFDVEATGHCFTVRSSDNKVLGPVKDSYTILQNREAFEFMDRLVGADNLVRYHTVGALRGGRIIWLLAEIVGLTIEPVPGDVTQPYTLLVNSHEGSLALQALETSVRVVCQNTLNLALSKTKGGVKIRHTGDMNSKLDAARNVLGYARKEAEAFKQAADHLAKMKMGDKLFATFLDQMFPLPEDKNSSRQLKVREQVTELYEAGPGSDIPGVRGSAWGALQAVTNFTSHHRSTRGAGSDEDAKREKRLEATWFGTGDTMNQRALRQLLDA